MTAFTVFVEGIPVPQGSMVSNGVGRGLRHSNHLELKPWRYQVVEMLNRHRPDDWDPSKPITVSAIFRLPRPVSHYGTGKNANRLKPTAPKFHIVKPDLDKLQRSIGDAVEESGLVRGDQQISNWNSAKRYCVGGETPGVLLTIATLPS